MCEICGTYFRVVPDDDGRDDPWAVMKHSGASIVYLDRFETERKARKFASLCHADRLKQHKKFGKFKECARL